MTLNDGFDRTVSDWLDEQAGRGAPGYLDEILTLTTRTRQRPAWSSLERWLPVQATLRLAPVPRMAWLLVVLALLVALGAAILAVGSRPHHAPPFGLARNGAIDASYDGDIYALDPVTHAARLIVGGDRFDFAPSFSRDGTKMLFLRSAGKPADDPGLQLMVADIDGTGLRALTPALHGLDWVDWSPDSQRIAFISRATGSGPGVINVINVDGTGLTTLPVGRPAHFVSWLPPDGREIVFRGEQLSVGDPAPGIFAVDPDGSGLHELSRRPPTDIYDYMSPAVAPDGSRVSYVGSDFMPRIHILDLRTGNDIVLPYPSGVTAQAGLASFSPDGRSIGYVRSYEDKTYQLVVAPADGSGTGVPIGPRLASPSGDINYAFTPDGSAIVADYDVDGATRLLPVDGSAGSILGKGTFAFADVQRLAP